MKLRAAFAQSDTPDTQMAAWLGYFRFQDPTTLKPNTLTFPSINCFIPFKDRIVPRLGSELLGQAYTPTKNWPTIGHKERFATPSGIETEVRVTRSDDANLKDIIDVLYPSPQTLAKITHGVVVGVFVANEVITGGTSGATALMTSDIAGTMLLYNVVGTFVTAETITGGTSGATTVVTLFTVTLALGTPQWYQVTQNVNPLSKAVGKLGMDARWYFDDWFDTNINAGLSLNISRLVGTNGTTQILSWSGGMTPIVSIVPNVSITTTAGVSWVSQGIINPLSAGVINFSNGTGAFIVGEVVTGGTSGATGTTTTVDSLSVILKGIVGTYVNGETITGGTSGATGKVTTFSPPITVASNKILVNGVLYTITGGWDTDTLTTASTVGIHVGDVAFSMIDTNVAPIPFDVCRTNDNYVFYGAWNSRKLYMSNGFGKNSALIGQTYNSISGLNDAVFSGNYTGAKTQNFTVTIDSVSPVTIFTGTGTNGLVFDYSGYSLSGTQNTYQVIVHKSHSVNDDTITYATTTGVFYEGETITSGANSATVIFDDLTSELIVVLFPLSTFIPGNTITGGTSGHTAIVQAFGHGAATFTGFFYSVYKNNAFVTTLPLQSVLGVPLAGPFVVADGITFNINSDVIGTDLPANAFGVFVQYNGTLQDGDVWQTTVTTSSVNKDTFSWTLGGASQGTHIPLSLTPIVLSSGISVNFNTLTGHAIGDTWSITATPTILDAWANFYYTLPTRIPGEGYIYNMSSNFWAMAPQESYMYVCSTYGDWAYVETKLAANLLTETVLLTPLKQTWSSKPIFPYMMSYMDNDIIFVTADKKLDFIGRLQLVQLPQIDNLSQPVQLDFKEASFENGSMEYWDKKLWITSPKDNVMLCYDNLPENRYWQPPQVIPENGILSTVNSPLSGVSLISHSNIRNQTNTLFTGTSGDNGVEYTVRARSPYLSMGQRWSYKNSNATFLEGYITGAPPMNLTVIQEINGCAGTFSHEIKPAVCLTQDHAPLGEGSLGSHQLGSDIYNQDSHFLEEYQRFNPILKYRQISLQFDCSTTNHSYSILDWGLNMVQSTRGNVDIKNKAPISRT